MGSLKAILTNMVAILMLAKLATVGLIKIKILWNKGYDVIISVHDATNKILSCDSNYIVDMVMWSKFGDSIFFVREVTTTATLQGLEPEKSFFLSDALGSS